MFIWTADVFAMFRYFEAYNYNLSVTQLKQGVVIEEKDSSNFGSVK